MKKEYIAPTTGVAAVRAELRFCTVSSPNQATPTNLNDVKYTDEQIGSSFAREHNSVWDD